MIDAATFRDFYKDTAAPLRRYVVRSMGTASHADDVIQESYLRLLRHPPNSVDTSTLRAYIFRIASNLMTDRWRKQKHETAVSEASQVTTIDTDAGLSLDMERTFRQLRPLDRQLMWLAYVEGADHREIAATLGLRERSIRVLLSRARKKLLEFLTITKSCDASALTRRTRRAAERAPTLTITADDPAEVRL
jgi:RNA polymerase sigma-70 factor (ECF subfamily)